MTDPQTDPKPSLRDVPIDQLAAALSDRVNEYLEVLENTTLNNDAPPEDQANRLEALRGAQSTLTTMAIISLQRTLLPVAQLAEAILEDRVSIGPVDAGHGSRQIWVRRSP
jgi:hypothetical protein